MKKNKPDCELEINASRRQNEKYEVKIFDNQNGGFFAFLKWGHFNMIGSPDFKTIDECKDWTRKKILESYEWIDDIKEVKND